ncbi:hypothetical protein [Aliikangiella coralliicola]|nr:hypothetical protein [Aliikangiella coralliicola]
MKDDLKKKLQKSSESREKALERAIDGRSKPITRFRKMGGVVIS